MLGPEVQRAAFKPVQLSELVCLLSTLDCAKCLQKGGRIDRGTGIGFGKLEVSLALLCSICDLETGFHSSVSVRMRIFPFFVLQGYED